MESIIINYTLNAPFNVFVCAKLVLLWIAIWHLIIKRILCKCDVTSFWYELYKLGAFGTLGIIVFLAIIGILLASSVELLLCAGDEMGFPILIFWGIVGSFFVCLIKHLRNK